MSDAFTAALRLCKPEVGADESSWGGILNTQTFDMIDEAVGGYVAISVASGDVTLSANNGTTDQARNAVIKFTGSPGTDRTVTAPNVEKTYQLVNGVGDSSNILFKATGGSTVTIPAGCFATVYTDGAAGAVILLLYGTGTFTPAFNINSSTTGITYAASGQIGHWTKIGRDVFFTILISLTSNGAGTGNGSITGLPFTSGSSPSTVGSGFAACSNISGLTPNSLWWAVAASGTTIALFSLDGTAATDSNIPDNGVIRISGRYEAAV